jgi:outer membrane immunogenic protein
MFVRSLTLGVAAAALIAGGAQAADLIIPTTPEPIYEAAGFDWEGLYIGARAGGVFSDDAFGDSNTYGLLGAAVGVNFVPVDPLLLGLEVTGDWVFGDDDDNSFDFFANVRAGAIVTDSVLVYGLAGVGVTNYDNDFGDDSVGRYQLGGGVEFAVTDAVTVRGEIVGLGDFDDNGDDDFFNEAKATVGVFYHF